MLERSPHATRQLASRARRRVQGEAKVPDADLRTQWQIVDAFLAAAREGDFDRLVALLDPDVVLKADAGSAGASEVQGAGSVAGQALLWSRPDQTVERALVNGAAGIVTIRHRRPFAVMGFTIRGGRIAELDILADPQRLSKLDLTILEK
jgi:RNA polymerase sigma-70 factor (ECF subfamily)